MLSISYKDVISHQTLYRKLYFFIYTLLNAYFLDSIYRSAIIYNSFSLYSRSLDTFFYGNCNKVPLSHQFNALFFRRSSESFYKIYNADTLINVCED